MSDSSGRYFEDFTVGDIYRRPIGRPLASADNIWLTLLTQNTARLHYGHHFVSQTPFGRLQDNSTNTQAQVTGRSVPDVSQNVMANLGWDEVRLPNPVFEGDTIYSQSEVLEARASRSRPEVGVVTVRTPGFNQDRVVVITFRRTVLVYRRGFGPVTPTLEGGSGDRPE